ncbi:MAG: hypothetical protein ACOYMA_00850 [Bacteroidia bacterium]
MKNISSISDNVLYPNFCKLAAENDEVFKTFKKNTVYNSILEHVAYEDAEKCVKLILDNNFCFMEKIVKFKQNDVYGSAKIYNFDKFGKFSPSTIRYIKVMFDLFKLFGNLDDLIITEVGAGYGG